MKDLYRRIGASSDADRLTLERAIAAAASRDTASAKAARHILLDPDRKAVYDRTHEVVLRIGQLRANLDLLSAPHWLSSDCQDFNAIPSPAPSRLQTLRAGHSHLRRKPAQHDRTTGARIRRGLGLGIGAMLLVCALPCFVSVLLESGSTGQSNTTQTDGGSPNYLSPKERSHSGPQPPVETREDTVRKLVTTRVAREGSIAEAAVEALVQKLLAGDFDPLPPTGALAKNFYGEGVAPLEIKTTPGTNYYVKVIDWTTKAEILTGFIRGGAPFNVLIPVGSYEIRYAAGEEWYGPILDFGEKASYSRCDDRFDFTKAFDGYNGYTIELIMQVGGNLETPPMSPDDF